METHDESLSMQDVSGSTNVFPVALGLISDPPTIVLTYDLVTRGQSGNKKQRRKRKMPLRDFTDKSSVKRCTFNLRQRHKKYLSSVLDVTLEKMLRIIQEIQKGKSIDASLLLIGKEYSIDPDEDMNVLSPAQLAQRKAMMDEAFQKNLVKPGDPGYVYDKVVTFSESAKDSNEWDDEEEDNKEKAAEGTTGAQDHPVSVSKITINSCSNLDDNNHLEIDDRKDVDEESLDVHTNSRAGAISESSIKVTTQVNIQQPLVPLIASSIPTEMKNPEEQVKQFSFPLQENNINELRTDEKSDKVDSEESSNDIENALANMETGDVYEEDEDFWQ